MNLGYTYATDKAVLEAAFVLPKRDRDRLQRAFEQLADNPFHRPDFELPRPDRAVVQVSRFGHWLVSWWADHAVKEVRIVGIERIPLR